MTETVKSDPLESLYAPQWAWDIIMETILMDCNSKAFDPDLRKSINTAYDAILPRDEGHDRVLDAMILWEAIESAYREGHFCDAFGAFGVCEMRSQVANLVQGCREAYGVALD